jgi:hypothetical protein
MTRRACHPRLASRRPARLERPLWTGDGLGPPDTVLVRAGQKEALWLATEAKNMFDASQHPLEDALKDVDGDALSYPH